MSPPHADSLERSVAGRSSDWPAGAPGTVSASMPARSRSATAHAVAVRVRQQHHELLAAGAGEQAVRAQPVPQRPGDRLQHQIAGQVPVVVVDALEVVQVDDGSGAARRG